MVNERLRAIPSVDAVLEAVGVPPSPLATDSVRALLAALRAEVRAGGDLPALDVIVERAEAAVAAAGVPSLRRIINATGVILQTNLGRAPLSERAARAVADAARGYTNLEFDLEAGGRGSRHEHVRDLIRRTTGAEDGLVVNNNAAGLFMALQVFAQGREVIVSRGQAVEIGGGFRIPDVLRQSGALLVEVGTTNRTYASDYAAAITDRTAAILRVHSSNFRVVGFTAEAALGELAELARDRGVLLLDDLGSGCLVRTEEYGLAHEPTAQESIAGGVDLALFSGDKLLGGPQCGVIAGQAKHIETLRRHPLARALRVDKLTIAALNATLMSYAEGREREEIPVWKMVSRPADGIRRRARRWAAAAGEAGGTVASMSMVGGGSLPGEGVATWCASIRAPQGATEMAAALRRGD
ncbi:MAG: L-seryl-tRNA(Sec) selenium transferase, partial [Dehalococcoidia bacterium]